MHCLFHVFTPLHGGGQSNGTYLGKTVHYTTTRHIALFSDVAKHASVNGGDLPTVESDFMYWICGVKGRALYLK